MAADKTYRYDVAISYAGEDRPCAEALAYAFRLQGLKVFYDQYEKSTLWGKDLYDHLSDVYQHQARYCVMLLSKSYVAKVWTTHEREAAQLRAVREKEEYILPIRLDGTELPGHLQTVVYLDWHAETVETVTTALLEKLGRSSFRVPPAVEKLAVLRTLTGHAGSVLSLAVSSDGQQLFSASSDSTIKVWDLSTGREVRTLTRHTDGVHSLAVSADGQQLFSASTDHTIKVWGT